MPQPTTQQIRELAAVAGLRLDDDRAEAVAARLGATLAALDDIPADALDGVEPALIFAPRADAPAPLDPSDE